MPAHAPALAPARVAHLFGAGPHLVDAAHVPAAVVQAGRVRFREGNQVVVAAMRRVDEGNDLARVVRQAQAQQVAAKRNHARYIG